MSIKRRLINNYKQYGLKIFIKRLIKRTVSLIINIETYILAKTNIDLTISIPKPKLKIKVLPLKKDEIKKMDISSQKKMLFYERSNSKDKICLTACHNSEIIYYCWVSLKKMQICRRDKEVELKNNEGFLFDAFCFPQWRGNMIHAYMSQERLRYLKELGKEIAFVSYLQDNNVAARILASIGFIPEKKIKVISIFKLINMITAKEIFII